MVTLENVNRWSDKYVGEVNQQNQPHGNGTLYDHQDRVHYYGQWQNGQKHGFGSEYQILPGVKIYEGQFVNGFRDGIGTSFAFKYTTSTKQEVDKETLTYHITSWNEYTGNWKKGQKTPVTRRELLDEINHIILESTRQPTSAQIILNSLHEVVNQYINQNVGFDPPEPQTQ